MCAEGRPDSIDDGLRFFAGARADAYLHRRAPTAGYTVVIWRGRHVAEPTELDEGEWQEFWREVLLVARALEAHYRPAKMNYQLLGNGVPHLHVHLVLRHWDDPAPNAPLPPTVWESGSAHPVAEADLASVVDALRGLRRGLKRDNCATKERRDDYATEECWGGVLVIAVAARWGVRRRFLTIFRIRNSSLFIDGFSGRYCLTPSV